MTEVAETYGDIIRDLGDLSILDSDDETYRSTHLDAVSAMEGLSRKTIGNILKSAFHGAGVLGSGHRLRAYWASETCARLWDEAFALNGFKWDQTVENAVLHDLARAMGHVKVSTTVRSYLDRELIRSLGLKDIRLTPPM
ncbi:hypothetical protein [Sphingobium yanoikuyae]|uniref:hypothetical protein n=1 Tax=Sphingobium yanoikuyae TaxID=13690 RepID=UPI00242D7EE5|nr:hypothetical protein [Sphingobium yanoikuyae]